MKELCKQLTMPLLILAALVSLGKEVPAQEVPDDCPRVETVTKIDSTGKIVFYLKYTDCNGKSEYEPLDPGSLSTPGFVTGDFGVSNQYIDPDEINFQIGEHFRISKELSLIYDKLTTKEIGFAKLKAKTRDQKIIYKAEMEIIDLRSKERSLTRSLNLISEILFINLLKTSNN